MVPRRPLSGTARWCYSSARGNGTRACTVSSRERRSRCSSILWRVATIHSVIPWRVATFDRPRSRRRSLPGPVPLVIFISARRPLIACSCAAAPSSAGGDGLAPFSLAYSVSWSPPTRRLLSRMALLVLVLEWHGSTGVIIFRWVVLAGHTRHAPSPPWNGAAGVPLRRVATIGRTRCHTRLRAVSSTERRCHVWFFFGGW